MNIHRRQDEAVGYSELRQTQTHFIYSSSLLNTLNTELNSTCHFLALLGAHHILHVSRIRVKPTVKVKQSRYRPGVAQKVPGNEGSTFHDNGNGGEVVSLTHRPPLPPGNTPGTHFC